MIGERLESHSDLPWSVLLFLAAGIGLAAGGLISGITGIAIGAVLPLALAGSIWLFGQERPFTATIREEWLEIESDTETTRVPYRGIQNIKAGGRLADPAEFGKSSCPIAVLHSEGVLRIPSRLNFPSHEVYRYLASRVPDCGGRDVNPVLADYLERQERRSGPESVATFRGASRRLSGAWRGYRAFCIGLVVGGAAWVGVGFSGYVETEWGAAGIVCGLLGAILYAAAFAQLTPAVPIKHWKKASLVIGPEGMAMVQGDIQGEVRWPELLEIRFNARPRGFSLAGPSAFPGILLRVKGASIVIADIYDRPLCVIYNRILAASGRSRPLFPDL
jgi:hypothetical protein